MVSYVGAFHHDFHVGLLGAANKGHAIDGVPGQLFSVLAESGQFLLDVVL